MEIDNKYKTNAEYMLLDTSNLIMEIDYLCQCSDRSEEGLSSSFACNYSKNTIHPQIIAYVEKYGFTLCMNDNGRFMHNMGAIKKLVSSIEFYLLSLNEASQKKFCKRMQYHLDTSGLYIFLGLLAVNCKKDKALLGNENYGLISDISDIMDVMNRYINVMLCDYGINILMKVFGGKIDTIAECSKSDIDSYITYKDKDKAKSIIAKYLKGAHGKNAGIIIQALGNVGVITKKCSRVKIKQALETYLCVELGSIQSINRHWGLVDEEVEKLAEVIRNELKR